MTTILLTGGAGFIGSHLAEKLLHEGYAVTILDNFDPYYARQIKEQNLETITTTGRQLGQSNALQFVEGDIRDQNCIASLFETLSAKGRVHTIHIAALAGVRPSIQRPLEYVDVNLMGLTNVLDQIVKHKQTAITFVSSSSVYGEQEHRQFKEDEELRQTVSPYAATKLAGELMCHTMSVLHGISVACLRYFTVYGPRMRPDLAIAKFSRMIKAGEAIPVFGDGSTRRDYTYVADIVDGTLKAMQWVEAQNQTRTPAFEVFNLGRGQTVSLADMIKAIETATGRQAEIDWLPMQQGDVPYTWADISKASKILGYAPKTTLVDGIQSYLTWLDGLAG